MSEDQAGKYTDLQRKIGNRHYKINTFPIIKDGETVLAMNIETWKLDGTPKLHHIQIILNDEGIERLLGDSNEKYVP